jgi:hypothetical protein
MSLILENIDLIKEELLTLSASLLKQSKDHFKKSNELLLLKEANKENNDEEYDKLLSFYNHIEKVVEAAKKCKKLLE